MKDRFGVWTEGDGIKPVIMDYYENIFTASNETVDGVEFFSSISPRISHVQNDSLNRSFEMEEVKSALFSMFPDKAFGPDGMNSDFYQHFWDLVGRDVIDFVLNCLNLGSLPAGLNDSNIVLIPKK